jgi:hypothetical protein
LGDVLSHFWYHNLRKNWGFVQNEKQKKIVVNVALHARDILDSSMTSPIDVVDM